MKHLIRFTDLNMDTVYKIFEIADELTQGKYKDALKGKTVVMFFPNTSIRTRVTFEKGIYLLGGQSILFPSETLDKKEDLKDVCGYLNNWADVVIVRHKDIHVLEKMANYLQVPLLNAMTDVNHPCEMLSDLYVLSKRRKDVTKDNFLFVGEKGNIGLAWKEASEVMGFSLEQCCAKGYEIEGLVTHQSIYDAVKGKDIICTDSIPQNELEEFKNCQVTKKAMDMANAGAVLNPCPPFYRGEEVSKDAIESDYFVEYEFKKCLLEVQQAAILYSIS